MGKKNKNETQKTPTAAHLGHGHLLLRSQQHAHRALRRRGQVARLARRKDDKAAHLGERRRHLLRREPLLAQLVARDAAVIGVEEHRAIHKVAWEHLGLDLMRGGTTHHVI